MGDREDRDDDDDRASESSFSGSGSAEGEEEELGASDMEEEHEEALRALAEVEAAAPPVEEKPKPVWTRLYEDHQVRLQRLARIREENHATEEEEIRLMQQQVLEDRRWVEENRPRGELGESIDDRLKRSYSGPWHERMFSEADEKDHRLRQMQEAYFQMEKEKLNCEIAQQAEQRRRMWEIFGNQDDDSPWHERLYEEAHERWARKEEREYQQACAIAALAAGPAAALHDDDEDDEGEHDPEALWKAASERLYQDDQRRREYMIKRRKEELESEMNMYKEKAIEAKGKAKRGPGEAAAYERLYEDSARRRDNLARLHREHVEADQKYQDENMARWMTETQKSRSCWPLKGDQAGVVWHDRLHKHDAEREKMLAMEREKRLALLMHELQRGREHLSKMIKTNARVARAPTREGCSFERLYIQAKEQRDRLDENRKERLEGDIPDFKPELVSRPLREDKAAERAELGDVGKRLHAQRSKNLKKLQEKRAAVEETERAKIQQHVEASMATNRRRIAQVAPKLLEDARPAWERLSSKENMPKRFGPSKDADKALTAREREAAEAELERQRQGGLGAGAFGSKKAFGALGMSASEPNMKKKGAGKGGPSLGKMMGKGGLGGKGGMDFGAKPGGLMGGLGGLGAPGAAKPGLGGLVKGGAAPGAGNLLSGALTKAGAGGLAAAAKAKPKGAALNLGGLGGMKKRAGASFIVNDPEILAEGPSQVDGAVESF